MKKILLGIFILSTLSITTLSAFDITENTSIILPEKPLKSTILAADELAKYVEKVSSIKLAKNKKNAKNFIYVGLASDFKGLPASLKNKLSKTKADDSYIFYAKDNKMFFAGKNKTAELYAVYQFLERELDICFFKPANKEDDGEYVPYKKREKIVIKDSSFVREPAYRRRLLVPTGWNWTDHPFNGVRWSVKGGFQMRPAYCHPGRIKWKNDRDTALYEPRTT
ncbi:MAG: hypothetical protein IKC08_08170, partial [Lentisphaeria bacterium]|nr:hypothetical protein [Lentisphaeria bacterium]